MKNHQMMDKNKLFVVVVVVVVVNFVRFVCFWFCLFVWFGRGGVFFFLFCSR
jgi:hypothetical protein